MRRPIRLAVSTLATWVAAVGCAQVLGLEEAALDAEGQPSSGVWAEDPTSCNYQASSTCYAECYRTECCSEITACRQDPGCREAFECAARCDSTDDDCVTACIGRMNAASLKLASVMSTCWGDCPCDCTADAVQVTRQAEHACVLALSCDPLKTELTISECLTLDRAPACAKSATDCATFAACFGRGWGGESSCTTATEDFSCVGERAFQCAAPAYNIDCAHLGGVCIATTANTWPCQPTGVTGITCSADSTRDSCQGNTLYWCEDGVLRGKDCAASGGTCLTHPTTQSSYCVEGLTTCETKAASCRGDTLVRCDSRGLLGEHDCTRAGLVCSDDGAGARCKARACSAAQVDECQEACLDDTRMRVCVGGAPFEIDCKNYNFPRCVTWAKHLVTGSDYVSCGE